MGGRAALVAIGAVLLASAVEDSGRSPSEESDEPCYQNRYGRLLETLRREGYDATGVGAEGLRALLCAGRYSPEAAPRGGSGAAAAAAARLAASDAAYGRTLCAARASAMEPWTDREAPSTTMLTPGKFVLYAADRHLRHGRPTYNTSLAQWRFLPRPCDRPGPDARDGWFPRDSCARGAAPPARAAPPAAAAPWGDALAAPLWWLAAGVRYRLRALGPCAIAARDALLATRPGRRGGGPAVAVHVRRGDACGHFAGDATETGRACYSADAYAAAVVRMCDPGQHTGDSTSLRQEWSRNHHSRETGIDALGPPRAMIARPKMSQIERETVLIEVFENIGTCLTLFPAQARPLRHSPRPRRDGLAVRRRRARRAPRAPGHRRRGADVRPV